MSQQRTMARGWTIEGFRSFSAKICRSSRVFMRLARTTSWAIGRGRSGWFAIRRPMWQ
jgi:hypothetical protein